MKSKQFAYTYDRTNIYYQTKNIDFEILDSINHNNLQNCVQYKCCIGKSDERKEKAVVVVANASVEPPAVVVELVRAFVALFTMFASLVHDSRTNVAEELKLRIVERLVLQLTQFLRLYYPVFGVDNLH